MRLATAGIYHESNTFASDQAELALFEQGGTHRGDDIRAQYGESYSTMAGFLEVEGLPGLTLEPILMANVNPCGPLTSSAYTTLAGEILDALEHGGPWDGVLLAQHGAAVAEGTSDLDGDFTAKVRQVVGDNVPIGVAVDMHANVSSLLFSSSGVLVADQTNPHVDSRPRARLCAELVLSTIAGEVRPVSAMVRVPVALHIAVQDTDQAPMSELLALTRSVEAELGLLSASLVEGFPYADVPHMGMAVVTIADGRVVDGAEAAIRIATAVWERRTELATTLSSPEEALEQAAATPNPTLVLDVGDNIGGGSRVSVNEVLEMIGRVSGRRLQVEVDALDVFYDRVQVLYGVDLHVRRGESGAVAWARVLEAGEGWSGSKELARPIEWDAMARCEERFDAAEDVRLLYVAVTRAKEELVVARWPDKPGESPWRASTPGSPIPPRLSRSSAYLRRPGPKSRPRPPRSSVPPRVPARCSCRCVRRRTSTTR